MLTFSMLLSEVERDGQNSYPHTADRYWIDPKVLPSSPCYELAPRAVSRAPEVQYHYNATLPAQGFSRLEFTTANQKKISRKVAKYAKETKTRFELQGESQPDRCLASFAKLLRGSSA